jgi:hypothetical protein
MAFAVNDTTNKPASLRVDDSGALIVTGGTGGGGGGGDASAANQVTQTTKLTSIDGKLTGVATSAKQDSQIALMPTPVDSTGLALPADFDYLAVTYGYTGSDLTTIVKTKGANTWTRTLTYSTGTLTAESKWVKA